MTKFRIKIAASPAAAGLIVLLLTAGCAGPGYYSQAISGHMRLMNQREDVRQVLDSGETDPELARELQLSLQVRDFAVQQLGLPDNDSYSQFVQTGQDAVTWNVVAAPEFSLAPKKWCFLGSGCVPYRGYFKAAEAHEFADSLAARGYDTTVSPAIAYSTLGWFDDPLLDTMFQYNDEQLAAFIFHELAHQQLYIKGDTGFNEAYANFVEEAGLTRWLESRGQDDGVMARRQLATAALQFNTLLQSVRDELADIYTSGKPADEMREAKSSAFARLADSYRALVDSQWEGQDYFRQAFSRELNNASLALVNTYQGGSCAFQQLYRQAGRDMARFHELAAAKARLSRNARTAWLNRPCEVIASNGDL